MDRNTGNDALSMPVHDPRPYTLAADRHRGVVRHGPCDIAPRIEV